MNSFINKDKPVEFNGLQFKCEPAKAEACKNDLQYILNKITAEDIKALKRLVDNPAKLAMARSFV
jgi:hypothetical protein